MRAFFFSSRLPYGHAQLSERGNTPSLMAILYFVEQKRSVGQGRLESPSLLCFMNPLRGERRLRKLKHTHTHTQQQQQQQIIQNK